MDRVKDFVARLTSRKFLLAVAAAVTAFANGEPVVAAVVAAVYVLVEGAVDLKAAPKVVDMKVDAEA